MQKFSISSTASGRFSFIFPVPACSYQFENFEIRTHSGEGGGGGVSIHIPLICAVNISRIALIPIANMKDFPTQCPTLSFIMPPVP